VRLSWTLIGPASLSDCRGANVPPSVCDWWSRGTAGLSIQVLSISLWANLLSVGLILVQRCNFPTKLLFPCLCRAIVEVLALL